MTTAAASVLNLNDTLFSNNNLHRSVASGQLTLVQRLIANGCDPNLPDVTTGLRPIHFAASRGHADLVKYLVETSKCQVDATDKEGEVRFTYMLFDKSIIFLPQPTFNTDCAFKSSLWRSFVRCHVFSQ